MRSSHSLDRLDMAFEDDHLVADAGLHLPATLAHHLGLRDLVDEHLDLGAKPGRANVGDKLLTLVMSALAGGDSIDDADALRAGGTERILGFTVNAASTLGTFLRSLRWGHVRQLDRVSRELLGRAWAAGVGPGEAPLTIDLDSTICETYGLAEQGARHTRTPTSAATARCSRSRPGPSTCSWHGCARAAPTRPAGPPTSCARRSVGSDLPEPAVRSRSAPTVACFSAHAVVAVCRAMAVRYSITIRQSPATRRLIEAIPEDAWSPIPYWLDGGADVAETTYTPFADQPGTRPVRLIVRRVRPTPGSQLAAFVLYDYHPFITDRDGMTLELEADHRRHAEVENAIRDLKYGMALNHLPSGRFAANGAWLAVCVIAHNLARWTARIGLAAGIVTTKTLRRQLFSLAGRLTRSARRVTLHLPAHWP